MRTYLLLLLSVVAMPTRAQSRFDVSVVRPSAPGSTVQDARFSLRGDRFEAKAATIGDILDMLGGFQLYRVVGGPAWMRTDRYDVEGKADQVLPAAERVPAVMALLAERFHLESHKEKRDVPSLVLRVSKSQAELKPAKQEERSSIGMNERRDVVFTASSMVGVTNYLSQMLGAPVVDETGLTGAYSFVLATSQIERRQGSRWGDWVREAIEDLGFRIENRRVPLEVTVVDRCERPEAN